MLNQLLTDLRHNARLRAWLALTIGALCLYGVLLLRDALQQAKQQEQSVAKNITRLRAQIAQPEWIDRLPPVQTLAVQLESRLWQAPTAGLAQAALQDWVNSALAQSKATRPLITVTVLDEIVAAEGDKSLSSEAAGTTPPDLWKIKAKVGFDLTPASLLEFLNRVEGNDKQLIVEALKVQKEPFSHVEIELLAYFQRLVSNKNAETLPARPPAQAASAAQNR